MNRSRTLLLLTVLIGLVFVFATAKSWGQVQADTF